MKKAYAQIPEGQVHYVTDGSGDPVLLLHQTPMSSDEYSGIVPILAQSYRVIAMDTLGYGNSDIPPREYEVEDYARSVISFLDVLGIKKTSIVGHHTGASIAVEVAAKNPDRVDKLILSGCPTMDAKEWEEFLASSRRQSPPPEIADDGQFIMNSWQLFKRWAPNTDPKTRIRPLVLSLMQYIRPYDAHYAVYRHNIKPLLPLIQSPTLLIGGTRDIIFNLLERTQSLLPRSKTKIFEDAGVLICFEKPREFAQAILDFMKDPTV